MNFDEEMIRRAIRLAMNGRGRVEPNPMVGCVLVRDGQIVGEGFHTHFGGPHAEPQALADCIARGNSPAGATAYVTLEPCCHLNKKTPPCAPRLIEAKIARVVIGCLDPNPDVDGNGVSMLQQAGIVVDRAGEHIEAECRQLIAPFLLRVQADHPYITLKWAQTTDGKIAGPNGARLQITGEPANRLVHQLRARSNAIMVGVNTVLCDDPLLTARNVEHSILQRRLVLDSNLRTPPAARVVAPVDGMDWTTVFYSSAVLDDLEKSERMSALLKAGAQLMLGDELGEGQVSLRELFAISDTFADVTHLLVEPGPALARSFFNENLAHRLWVFYSPKTVNDDSAPSAAEIPPHFVETGRLQVGVDLLIEYINTRSKFCFARTPSADFVLAAEQ